MNADNATTSADGNVEKTIVAMSDTKQENNAFPWVSACIRVHPRLSLLRTVNGYRRSQAQERPVDTVLFWPSARIVLSAVAGLAIRETRLMRDS